MISENDAGQKYFLARVIFNIGAVFITQFSIFIES